MIAITGANGNLGRLVIHGLLKTTPKDQIVAVVRTPEKAGDLAQLGIQVRAGDYDQPETLRTAFQGVEKVLLISAVERGRRLDQHKNAVDAAKANGVKLLAYTSILRTDTSTLILADEHKATEEYIQASGLQSVMLRNGWYFENHTGALAPALQHGAVIGSAREGRFASASRADYADAAVAVLTQPGHENKVYELAGDKSFSMTEYAAEISKQAGKTIVYNDLPSSDYAGALLGFGLPQMIVDVVIDADLKSQKGELDSSSNDLSRLIGRPTTTVSAAIASALKA